MSDPAPRVDPAIELKRLELEAETRRIEARSKVRQVIYGTMIVGLAAAAFPFTQKLAELIFTERIELARLAVERQKMELEQVRDVAEDERRRREFLNSLAAEARSTDIEKRIILAEFFAYLAVKDSEKTQWKDFLGYLQDQQKALNAERQVLLATSTDSNATALDIAAAEARLQQIERLESPVQQNMQPASAGRIWAPGELYSLFVNSLSTETAEKIGLRDPRVRSALKSVLDDGQSAQSFSRALMAEAGYPNRQTVSSLIPENSPALPLIQERLSYLGIQVIPLIQ